ncbi:hypothetical protein [Sphingomonas radiodurans]|uniref:hypothetical protein n=1 Tax=Sphingomonas radiodurans TaxID=2890321 RepID=UPI001E5FE264|nr:hypothetical protein [Sphingomonas radiodurans]WBH15704.1 hypothetical protein LLW23_12865 [Sphingomonas radiodurans]
MRIATTASVAILALSTAALAQVVDPSSAPTNNNVAIANTSGPGNSGMPAPSYDTAGGADNMLDDSASPPPIEPK